MPIQQIQIGGAVVGFQARNAAGTHYFSCTKHGGEETARARAKTALRVELGGDLPRQVQSNNRSGIPGIRLVWRPSMADDGLPTLHVQVSANVRGRQRATKYSVERHGALQACSLAIEKREAWTGTSVGLTARQVWAAIKGTA